MDIPPETLSFFPTCRSLWASRDEGEEEASTQRIIHTRILQFFTPLQVTKLGLRLGQGYNKCGSQVELDWVQNFKVFAFLEDEWRLVLEQQNIPEPNGVVWLDFPPITTSALSVQVRKSGVDRWWPSWNVAINGIAISAEPSGIPRPLPTRNLLIVEKEDAEIQAENLPDGVRMESFGFEVRYKTRFYEIGFLLQRAALTYFSLDEVGRGRTTQNCVKNSSFVRSLHPNPLIGYTVQGPRLYPVGMPEVLGYLDAHVEGQAKVIGNRVEFSLMLEDVDQRYQLSWEMFEDYFNLTLERESSQSLHAWMSSAWHIAFDSKTGPVTALGNILKKGEAGLLVCPVVMHIPGKGSLEIETDSPSCLVRFDSIRPLELNTLEFKLGEDPQPEGDYILNAGQYSATLHFKVCTPDLCELDSSAPPAVQDMARFRAVTSLVYRADTATFSNNGNSMHAPICLDSWAELVAGFHSWHAIKPADYLQQTIERWLVDAPGYASGRTIIEENQFYEDEYLQTGTSALFGLSIFLKYLASPEWFEEYQACIFEQVRRMKLRDLDGDGLIESKERLGISGQYQWSTNWWDVLSFGWKDAFVNAFLYAAIMNLGDVFATYNLPDQTQECRDWATNLRSHYVETFYNEETGWLGGWRSKDVQLHDYAFLFVNGAAVQYGLVEDALAAEIMGKLWQELAKTAFKDYTLGLPGNLWQIPDADMAQAMHGAPMGVYENGGATHSQARHFISGLYTVGMQAEGDLLLEQLSRSLVNGTAFGGVGSGIDWRMWDGTPCGYEGLLCDQFGILVPAMQRWAKNYFNKK